MIPSCDNPMVPKAKAYEEFDNTSVVLLYLHSP